jgi:Xaa-Pro aminopeptidase
MEKREQKVRLEKIFKGMDDVDAVVIINTASTDPTFLYLTGFAGGLDSYESAVLVATRKRIFLIISPVEYQTAMEQKTEMMQVVDNRYDGEVIGKLLTRLIKGKRIGINAPFLPVKIYDNLKSRYSPKSIVEVSEKLIAARLTKDEDEIRRIRKAVKVTKAAMQEIVKHFKEGVTEQQIAARFDFIQMSLGATEVSFRTISSGRGISY